MRLFILFRIDRFWLLWNMTFLCFRNRNVWFVFKLFFFTDTWWHKTYVWAVKKPNENWESKRLKIIMRYIRNMYEVQLYTKYKCAKIEKSLPCDIIKLLSSNLKYMHEIAHTSVCFQWEIPKKSFRRQWLYSTVDDDMQFSSVYG